MFLPGIAEIDMVLKQLKDISVTRAVYVLLHNFS
jgi:hypothetical protein